MGKLVNCPGGCGTSLDYDAVPSYSSKRERAGKFCTTCGFPLDEDTAKKDVIEHGPDSHEVMSARASAAKSFHAASAAPPKDDKK